MIFASGESSSAARAGAAARTSPAPSAQPIAARIKFRSFESLSGTTGILITPDNSRHPYQVRSGRFYGTAREQGFIQQAHHPGNDRYISEVKNIPVKPPIGGGYVE